MTALPAVPEEFAAATAAREGEAGRAWLAALPALAADYVDRWRLTPAGPAGHGEVGLVLPVDRADGTPAVLKISFTHPGNDHEPTALAAWNGNGAVRLLERDDARYAMLLERAHVGATLHTHPDPREPAAIAGDLARRLSVPAPPGLPRGTDVGAFWAARITALQDELGRPLPARTVGAALDHCREVAARRPGPADRLVHGDFHRRNILRADREPWLAIDPKGWCGDPAYEPVIYLRTHLLDVAAGTLAPDEPAALAGIFADAAGLDPDAVRRWAQARAVKDALQLRRDPRRAGLAPLADALADRLAA